MKNKNILIFCQSPKDLKYALAIYKKNRAVGNHCTMIVREVVGIFEFIKTLKLDLCNLIFMRTYSLKHPMGILKQRQESKLIIEECNGINFEQVHFFSNMFDTSTPYIIKHISSKEVCFYGSLNYPRHSISDITLKEIIRKVLILCFFSLHSGVVGANRSLLIRVSDIVTNKLISEDVNVDSAYMLKSKSTTQKQILFLDFNDENHGLMPNSNRYFDDFYHFFTRLGYHIVVKGHPRVGLSNFITNYDCSILEESVPSEFIDISNFQYIFSVCSASLISFPQEISFSLIGYFEVMNEEYYKDYLKGLGMCEQQFIANKQQMFQKFKV